MTESILTKILNEVVTTKNYQASADRFKIILPEIEKLLDRRVLFYFASEVGMDYSCMVNDEDAFVIENLLSIESSKKDLVLILHSNGGFSPSAERIIDVCKNYCKKKADGSEFIVIVPKRAKSAATILSLGSDKVYLRNTAELGPIDPQLPVTDANNATQFIPAYLQVDAIENLLGSTPLLSKLKFKNFFNNKKAFEDLRTEIKIKFFDQCNYPLYITAKNEIGLSDSIIEKITKEKIDINPKILKTDLDIFRDPHLTKSHGRLINLNDLKDNSLCKEKVINSLENLFDNKLNYQSVDELLFELYVRKRQLLNDPGNQIVKTIETINESFSNSGKKSGQP